MSGLVPDDFDFDAARTAPSTTPPEERPRCPECRELAVRKKTGKPNGRVSDSRSYRCNRCSAHFEEPVYGERGDDR